MFHVKHRNTKKPYNVSCETSTHKDNAHTRKTPLMPQVIAITNQKGGVGKTTTAVNLATALAAIQRRVLVIDLDPQGNATTGFGIDKENGQKNIYHVLIEQASIPEATTETIVPQLHIVTANMDLSGADIELMDQRNREGILKARLAQQPLPYDYIFIDCPPGIGFLTLNALTAADQYLIPVQCEFYALEGLSHLMRLIKRVKSRLNPSLDLNGVILTMYDKRNSLSDLVTQDVKQYFGDKVYQTLVPRNVRISEAPSHGKPVMLYDHRSAGSEAYAHLAGEMLQQETPQEIT